jgi:hypothetical protein
METHTFAFRYTDFDDLMRGKSGIPATVVQLFARVASLNAAGHHIRIVDQDSGVLIHEFLPRSRSSESSEAPNPAKK